MVRRSLNLRTDWANKMVHYGICELLAYPFSRAWGHNSGYISQLSLMRSQLTVNFSTLCAGCLCWEGLVRWMERVFWGFHWCFLPCVPWVAYLIPAIVLLPPRVQEHMADAWKKDLSLRFLHTSIHYSSNANFSITLFAQPYVVFSSFFYIANVVLLPVLVRHATAVHHSSFDGLLFAGGCSRTLHALLHSRIDFRTNSPSTALLTAVNYFICFSLVTRG